MAQSQSEYDVVIARNIMLPMRDGVRLATDIYRPAQSGEPLPGPFPVILTRTPYDKATRDSIVGSEFWARRGYVRAVQDVRGRFASEGEFYLLRNEAEDGYDTVEWLATQPWCSGRVGMVGTSYLAWVQSAAASLNPPHLAAMWINQGAFNGLTSSLRHGGALELRWLAWAFWNAPVGREALADPAVAAALDEAATDLRAWLRALPWREGQTPLSLVPAYERWALDIYRQGLETDDVWTGPSTNFERHAAAAADVPSVYASGWYDSYTRAATESFACFHGIKQSPQQLIMGPWTHGDTTLDETFSGDLDFGPAATVSGNLAESVAHQRLRFFDHHLKGLDSGWEEEPPARIFVMGGGSGRKLPSGRIDHGGRWREETAWPLARARPWALHLHADRALREDAPLAGATPSRYAYDPARPVPTISANISSLREYTPLAPGVAPIWPPTLRSREVVLKGGADQRERPDVFGAEPPYLPLSARPDVLVFQTGPLERDTEVTGPITVHLWVSTDAPDTDFTAALIDAYPPSPDYPDGYALRLTDSIKRLRFRDGYAREEFVSPGEVVPVSIELYPTSNVFTAGHRIRLDISSSNFPRFDPNPNTGEPLGRHTHTVVARNAVHHDADHPSRVELPVVDEGTS